VQSAPVQAIGAVAPTASNPATQLINFEAKTLTAMRALLRTHPSHPNWKMGGRAPRHVVIVRTETRQHICRKKIAGSAALYVESQAEQSTVGSVSVEHGWTAGNLSANLVVFTFTAMVMPLRHLHEGTFGYLSTHIR
jgi:hypothetical protein